ncbi:MAG: type II secretion system protein [Eubacteriales bacterium]|nr:type II secretion system protein [Eubacteriales bacterium]
MLKLRKNKNGFTLVELIVVIAIMAVLAGVVAGVTVSQLNKQTDKTGVTQANTISSFLSTCIQSAETDDAESLIDEQTNKFTQALLNAVLTKQYSATSTKIKQLAGSDTPSKGYIDATVNADGTVITVQYVPKVTGKGATYYVSLDGTVSTTPPTTGNQGG